MFVLALAALLALPSTHMEERQRIAEELKAHPEPALETRADLPAVEAALRTPERLWRFVLAPDTPWADRMVAAQRSKLPMSFLPRMARVDREITREWREHQWGMEQFLPRYSAMAYMPRGPFHGTLKRKILGRDWTLPEGIGDEPLTYEEKSEAPWPWQVQQALVPIRNSFFDPSRAAEFWEEALSLPRDDVETARYFYQLTDRFAMVARKIDPRVIGVWREIGLREEAEFLPIRPEIAYAFDAIGLCRSGDTFRYAEVMMADWAEHWSARDVVTLAFRLHAIDAPPVADEVLARRIDGLGVEDVFTRGYAARYFLEAVDPAALPKAGVNPNDPELLERQWLAFRDWYGRHFEELRETSLAHEKLLVRYR
jgi:hypothetical protein